MRISKTSLRAALAVAAVGGLAAVAVPALAAPSAESAAQAIVNRNAPGAIRDNYIVMFKNAAMGAASVNSTAANLAKSVGGRVEHNYDSLGGFSIFVNEQGAARLAQNPAVAYVQQAHVMQALDEQPNPPSWGLDRIDQQGPTLNSKYVYPGKAGEGVHAYVLDSGLNANHEDFAGRVGTGRDTVDNDSTPQDCNGHGTHVAGTVAGSKYGVAKKATVHAVRVLDCSGSGSNTGIIAGINWVKSNAVKPAVVNYSIGCRQRCSDQTLDNAVASLIQSGVQWVQAAGNSDDDACYYSPQKLPEAVTVGNIEKGDKRYTSGPGPSSYGSCLDIWAPGYQIVSASYSSNTGTATMTGTSMASPHVAGVAALYLSLNPNATPQQVRDALVNNGAKDKLTGINTGSPNVLLNVEFMNTPGTTPVSVTNPGDQTGTVGKAASLQINASGGKSPYTYSAAGLPAGLSISSSSGLISGTPSTAGTYNVTVTVTDSSSPAQSGTAKFAWTINPDNTGCSPATNDTDYAITDNNTTESSVTVNCSGTGSSASVKVDINHTYVGDLQIDLVAPDGTVYGLKKAGGASPAGGIHTTYTANVSGENRNGTWKLRVQDVNRYDQGNIDTWTLTV